MKRGGPLRRSAPMSRGQGFRRRDVGLRGLEDGVDVVPEPTPPPKPASNPQRPRATLGPITAAIRPQPKSPSEWNQRLRDLARGRPCLLRWQRGCLRDDGSTTVLCHENRLAANKGASYKGHDWRSVWGCFMCHRPFDQGDAPHDVLDMVFAGAWERQLVEWTRITENPGERAWAKAAAAWALERAAAHGVGVKR